MIDWVAFIEVFVASVAGAAAVVSLYALGLRLLAVSGRTPYVAPREFDEAITVVSPKQIRKETKRVKKVRKNNPYSDTVKTIALVGAVAAFAVAAAGVLYGLYLIVPYFH